MLHTAKSIIRRGGVCIAVASFLTVPVAIAGTTVLASAPAGASVTGGCQFTGTTTSLTPIPKASDSTPLAPNQGSFGFHGPATCVVNGNVVSGFITVADGAGHYTNYVCGTGNATGHATFTSTIGLTAIDFTITFVAGAGTLQVTGGATGAGVVQIAPQPTTGCVTTAATGFTVTGAFAGQQ